MAILPDFSKRSYSEHVELREYSDVMGGIEYDNQSRQTVSGDYLPLIRFQPKNPNPDMGDSHCPSAINMTVPQFRELRQLLNVFGDAIEKEMIRAKAAAEVVVDGKADGKEARRKKQ